MEQLDNTLTKLEKFLKDEKVCSETDEILKRLGIATNYNNKLYKMLKDITLKELDENDKNGLKAQLNAIKSQLEVINRLCQNSEKSADIKEKINAYCDQVNKAVGAIFAGIFPEKSSNNISEERKALLSKAQQLRKSQEALLKDNKFIAALEATQARALDSSNPYTTSSVYFCYAKPHEKFKQDEDWVQGFIKNLQGHLAKAGIELTQLSENMTYSEIKETMKASDFALVFGTESLREGHDDSINATITTLLNSVTQKRINDKKEGNAYRVLPILLSGKNELSFPINYDGYMTITDWTKNDKDYAYYVRVLLEKLYNVGRNDSAFHKIWSDYSGQRVSSPSSSSSVSNKKDSESKVCSSYTSSTSSQSTVNVLSVLSASSSASVSSNVSSSVTDKLQIIENTIPLEYKRINQQLSPEFTTTMLCVSSTPIVMVSNDPPPPPYEDVSDAPPPYVNLSSKEPVITHKKTEIETWFENFVDELKSKSNEQIKAIDNIRKQLPKIEEPYKQVLHLIGEYNKYKNIERPKKNFLGSNRDGFVYALLDNWFEKYNELLQSKFHLKIGKNKERLRELTMITPTKSLVKS